MSNTILFDSLLVHFLARELDKLLRDRACAAVPLFAVDRSVTLVLDNRQALQLDLHPTRGWIQLVPWDASDDPLDAVCVGVHAPADERLLEIRLRVGDRFRIADRRLVVELHTNQWNALLVADEDGRVVSALRSRTAGQRVLRPGYPYEPPPYSPRLGSRPVAMEVAWEKWLDTLRPLQPTDRRAALIGGFAYTGAVNADWILGVPTGSDVEDHLWRGFERWWWLHQLPTPRPVLIQIPPRRIPYPVKLEGLAAEPIASLLAGMERVAGAASAESASDALRPEQERLVRRRIAAVERRMRRLEDQIRSVGEATRLRSWGDLLLANLHAVPRGASEARLTDWDGVPLEIPLDPVLSPAENATRLYDRARKRERAEMRLPELLARANEELARWEEAARLLEAGEAPEWLARELERSAGYSEQPVGESETIESRPYRIFRTSGQLEVRVGRSARENDRLTFGHSRPNDVWLHARSVAGSHVILRWNDPDNAPPARDLAEAATLAAVFSKARTSSLVPVDWTRRKYVRKPRGAPAGAVIPSQVRTIFVEPDSAIEERLKA